MKTNINITFRAIIIALLLTATLTSVVAKSNRLAVGTGKIKIRVSFPEAAVSDDLILELSTHIPISAVKGAREFRELVMRRKDKGQFEIDLPLSSDQNNWGVYFSIVAQSRTDGEVDEYSKAKISLSYGILEQIFAQNGDDITIVVKKKKGFASGRNAVENCYVSFFGKELSKFRLRRQIDSLSYSKDLHYDYVAGKSGYNINNGYLKDADSLLAIIQSHQDDLNKTAFEELKIHAYYLPKYKEAIQIYNDFQSHRDSISLLNRIRFADEYDHNDTLKWHVFNRQSLYHSFDFWNGELVKYKAVSTVRTDKWIADSLISALKPISDKYLRERLFLLSAVNFIVNIKNYNDYLRVIALYILTPSGKAEFDDLKKAQVGQPAFNFELPDTGNKKVKLSDFKGKVVFVDFWYTGCENCAYYYANVLSKVEEIYKGNPNVVFITICIDRNKDSWVKSVNSKAYTSPTAINLFTDGKGQNVEAIKYFNVLAYPSPFIIDKNHNILAMGDLLRNRKELEIMLRTAENTH